MLTGESVPIEAGAGVETYAGALVRRGEAVAQVTATGARTKFGRTAELVRTARRELAAEGGATRGAQSRCVQRLVIVLLVAYASFLKMPLAEIIPSSDGGSRIDTVALPPLSRSRRRLCARAGKARVLPTRLSAWMKRRRWMSCAPTRPAR